MTVYTTGQAAKLTGLSPKTLTKCIDAGRLRGYRLPGSRHRRVERADLLGFLVDSGWPVAGLAPTPEELAAAKGGRA